MTKTIMYHYRIIARRPSTGSYVNLFGLTSAVKELPCTVIPDWECMTEIVRETLGIEWIVEDAIIYKNTDEAAKAITKAMIDFVSE